MNKFLRPRYGWLLIFFACLFVNQVELLRVEGLGAGQQAEYHLASGSHLFASFALVFMGAALVQSVFSMGRGGFWISGALLMVGGPFVFIFVCFRVAFSYWGGP